MKLIGKLEDGTVFVKKGHDDEPPFEFKVDEGKSLDTTVYYDVLLIFGLRERCNYHFVIYVYRSSY